LGLVLASLLAAFMSTVDTHLNWGASYIVNDWLLKIFPRASNKVQIRVAKLSVFFLLLISLTISFYLGSIEKGWRAIATIGAAFGIPTLMRWFWWRLNADAEFLAIAVGIIAGSVFAFFTDTTYELRLIITSLFSLSGAFIGVYWGKPTDAATLSSFISKVQPIGFWPDRSFNQGLKELFSRLMKWFFCCSGLILIILALHKFIFLGKLLLSAVFLLTGGLLIYLAISGITKNKDR
jgi:hypothetical protein